MEYDADLRSYDPLDYRTHHLRPPRRIGKSAGSSNLVIYTTHSSEKARANYLRMVSLMERERYYSQYAHSVLYTNE